MPSAARTCSTTWSNPLGSAIAISDRVRRSSSIPTFSRPAMNWEYRIPRSRTAALMRMIHRRRNSRFLRRRSRWAYTPARMIDSFAVLRSLRRPPTYPSTRLKRRFLARWRGTALFVRIFETFGVGGHCGQTRGYHLTRFLQKRSGPNVARVWTSASASKESSDLRRSQCLIGSSPPAGNPQSAPQTSVTVFPEGFSDSWRVNGGENPCSTQFSLSLGRNTNLKMAGTCTAVLDLTGSGQAKTLLCAFVCFLLWHHLPPERT
jgi:hypothetical protein